MLNCSFTHIPSVGASTEQRIWHSGIHSMDDFLATPPAFLSAKKRQTMAEHIRISKDHLHRGDAGYFYDHLPSREHWRIFREFQQRCVYLDIETTGLSSFGDIITTIALYDGRRVQHFINGENLDDFPAALQQYDVIVTYNGKTFDIPFIEQFFGITVSQPHIDLRYILGSLGYRGGLKSCEKQLGIGRDGDLAEVDGFFAVLLWHDYQRNKQRESLDTLLAYNIEDVLNLEYLMITAYNKKLLSLPVSLSSLTVPKPVENPFAIHGPTVRRLQGRY